MAAHKVGTFVGVEQGDYEAHCRKPREHHGQSRCHVGFAACLLHEFSRPDARNQYRVFFGTRRAASGLRSLRAANAEQRLSERPICFSHRWTFRRNSPLGFCAAWQVPRPSISAHAVRVPVKLWSSYAEALVARAGRWRSNLREIRDSAITRRQTNGITAPAVVAQRELLEEV